MCLPSPTLPTARCCKVGVSRNVNVWGDSKQNYGIWGSEDSVSLGVQFPAFWRTLVPVIFATRRSHRGQQCSNKAVWDVLTYCAKQLSRWHITDAYEEELQIYWMSTGQLVGVVV
jgi:hypothetical protein